MRCCGICGAPGRAACGLWAMCSTLIGPPGLCWMPETTATVRLLSICYLHSDDVLTPGWETYKSKTCSFRHQAAYNRKVNL